jgi:Putative DNA-binding domain
MATFSDFTTHADGTTSPRTPSQRLGDVYKAYTATMKRIEKVQAEQTTLTFEVGDGSADEMQFGKNVLLLESLQSKVGDQNFRAQQLQVQVGSLPDSPEIHAEEPKQPSTIEALLERGESETLEFKSSLRLGVPSGTVEPVVEKSILKTVAAFVNSYKGGTLVIGVEDNGNILGVEYDFSSLKKGDLDGYELHLRNLLNREFGGDSAPFIEVILHSIEDKHVCEVRVMPGRRAYMLSEAGKDGQKKQQFYVRTGNQTVALNMEEALRYAADRWMVK